MNKTVTERIQALRQKMQERGIDAYLIPTDDFHASEYVGDYFKCRKYMTGFSGSAGTAVITASEAGLWTDGRYFIQAGQELAGSPVTLYKMGQPCVPTVHEYLKSKLKKGQCLGFDGRTVGAREAGTLKEELKNLEISFCYDVDLVGEIWEDRPALSCQPVMELEEKWCGKSRNQKLKELRAVLMEKKADALVLTCLDDIAWLLNIRGGDVLCNPVVLSYLLVKSTEVILYANRSAFSEEILQSLGQDGVLLKPYDEIYTEIGQLVGIQTIMLCKDKVNFRLVNSIPQTITILNQENPTLLPKAIKNPVEVENERIAHIKDGVAVTRLMYYLKKNVGKIPMTELSIADTLYQLRKEQEHFMGDSFEPIVAYGPHAAMCHYSPSPESDVPVLAKGLLLADTGGQYLEGTTDITRTFAVGPLTAEEKKYFTLVLKGHLNLGAARFLYGCTGFNLDYLAREPLWQIGEDFNHGTGHGVGYFLNVHEGPNGIRWRRVPGRSESAVFEEGMITSDEPGYYREGAFGIRHENLMVCKKAEKNAYGQFMKFEFLTMVPFDLDGVDPLLMTDRERKLLNEYHEKVYQTIAPLLSPEEAAWLRTATREI